ncbi:hypothetical protein O181_078929 [Austropuccinia psidii MF-1]|uniref:Uncharacterized protein n=1 Tax=Austropuccinia psidii MF-1 TaxID=1389203 RepID=A0A9Q3IHR8_9BASI|nr:hypothetical protein [Austropuccinia psidii MF-1]
MPDGLSRIPQSEDEEKQKSDFDEEEEWIKQHPGFGVKHNNLIKLEGIKLPSKQEVFWKRAVEYLNTLKRLFGSKEDDFKKIKRKSSNFFLEEGQLQRRNKLNPQAVVSMKYWDRKLAHQIRKKINPGEIVLVYNKELESQRGLLFKNRWDGPYRAVRQINNGPYVLEGSDGTKLARRYAESQIKKFYPRGKKLNSEEEEEEEEEEVEDKSQFEDEEDFDL